MKPFYFSTECFKILFSFFILCLEQKKTKIKKPPKKTKKKEENKTLSALNLL